MTRPLISALTAILLLVVAAVGTSSSASAAEDVHIDVANFYFCDPSFLNNVCETTIAAGDTVVWDDVGGLHTVTQCDDTFSACPPSGGFDSGFLNPDDTFTQTFDTPGTVSYWCSIHPVQMRGRIIVEAQETPTPTPAATPPPTTMPTSTPGDGTPTASPVITPADVPSTGGAPNGNGDSSLLALIVALGIAIASASVLTLVGTRRR
ncbi:MAG: hypothetical protein IH957_06430 [Chloroflexi bacterium]|nr:hypothetical protein [Chloroflexota bacterium]